MAPPAGPRVETIEGSSLQHSSFVDQIFNDDLLFAEADRDLAARQFPAIMHVLYHPALRDFFEEFDVPANAAKRRSRIYGLYTVTLGTLAIMGAAADVWVHAEDGPAWLIWVIAVSASAAGVASMWFGSSGVLFGKAKSEWLHRRFMTETIRQFHFQSFVAHASDIARSLADDGAKDVFLRQRAKSFEAFRAEYKGKLPAKLAEALSSETDDGWLHGPSGEADEGSLAALEPVFQAYRELRIRHQIDYANWRLREDHRVFSDAPRRQASVLEVVSLLCIGSLFLLHLVIIAGVALQIPHADKLLSVPFSIIVIWIAAIALGVRALEQGLQPDREVERYQAYRSSSKALLQRFDAATPQEKLKLVREMERLAYDEMRNFLPTNFRAKFVI